MVAAVFGFSNVGASMLIETIDSLNYLRNIYLDCETAEFDIRSADRVLVDLCKIRQMQLSNAEISLALTDLQRTRQLLICARRKRKYPDSGKVVYLSIKQFPHAGQTANAVSSQGDIFREALATHPVLRAAATDKLAEVIRDLDLTIFALEQRTRSTPFIAKTINWFTTRRS